MSEEAPRLYGHPRHALSESDARAALAAYDRAAILVTSGPSGLRATHLPLFIEDGRAIGHVARANPIWREAPCPALLIAPGPETYVSPGWYETKKRDGRAVPTWNYETIQAWGALTIFEDAQRLHDVVARLSARHEDGRAEPWRIEDAPADYTARLIAAIVGVEIALERVEAKRKLSQEKTAPDFDGVLAALSRSEDPRDGAVAAAMKRVNQS